MRAVEVVGGCTIGSEEKHITFVVKGNCTTFYNHLSTLDLSDCITTFAFGSFL
jgi:hypothetical protein